MYFHMLNILGRATIDPVLQDSKDKTSKFCLIPVAVNQKKKNKNGDTEEEVYYYEVLLFGKMAENAVANVKKADTIAAIGTPQFEAYISKKDKKKAKYKATLVADKWQVFK